MVEAKPDTISFERKVAAFEQARLARKPALIADYLADVPNEVRAELACELIRVDLEIAGALGEDRSLEDYRETAPEVFAHPRLLAQAAFEEWRLGRAGRASTTALAQIERYGLSPTDWPVPLREVAEAGPHYPAVGDAFDGMPLERVLGAGAFSRVYVARQPRFGMRAVALKITATTTVEPDRLGRLQHTNIVPVYSVHADRGLLGIAMPLLGDQTLVDVFRLRAVDEGIRSTLRAGRDATVCAGVEAAAKAFDVVPNADGRAVPWRQGAVWIADLADGLAHAHKRGVVHGDIKPANILIGDDGVARLLDFNLASEADPDPAATLIVGGTLPYLAPEHLEGLVDGRAATAACDIYSLAVVLFEILAGAKPFPDRPGQLEHVVAAMIADRRHQPVLPTTCLAAEGLRAIVEKALNPQPDDRFSTAADFVEELRRELTDQPLRLTSESFSGKLRKWSRRSRPALRKWLLTASLAAAVVATGLGITLNDRVSQLAAKEALAVFRDQLLEARLTLGSPQPENDLQEAGRRAVETAARTIAPAQFHSRFTEEERREVFAGVGELSALSSVIGGSADVESIATTFGVPAARSGDSAFLEALDSLHAGRYRNAVRLLRAAVDEQPQDPALWLQYGVATAASGDLPSAVAAFTAAGALQPRSGVVQRIKARALLDAGRYGDALSAYATLEAADQRTSEVQMNRALALLGAGRPAEAVEAASSAIAGGLDCPRAYLVRAKCRDAAGELAGAESDRQAARSLQPVDDSDWAARALSIERSDPRAALAEIDRGLEAYPNSVVLLRNRLHLLGDVLGRREEALGVADRLIALLPEDMAARLSRAVCLASLDRTAEALAEADEAAEHILRPIDQLQLACVYSLSSQASPTRRDSAVSHAVRAVSEQPALAARAASDPDLASLRTDTRFRKSLMAATILDEADRQWENKR